MNNTKILYLRVPNPRAKNTATHRGDPIACVVSEVNNDAGVISFALSIANPRDGFNKTIARRIAEGRHAVRGRFSYDIYVDSSRKLTALEITYEIMKSIVNVSPNVSPADKTGTQSLQDLLPARVRDAARAWCQEYQIRHLETN